MEPLRTAKQYLNMAYVSTTAKVFSAYRRNWICLNNISIYPVLYTTGSNEISWLITYQSFFLHQTVAIMLLPALPGFQEQLI